MPVIPGAQEGQVLNAGSPVPIASPEEARMTGNATTAFGAQMFALGDALDKEAGRQKAKRDTLTELLALQQGRQIIQKQAAEREQAAPLPEDATGYGQVQAFHDNLQEPFSEILDSIPDPETRRGAQAKLLDAANDTAREVYAREVVKRAANNEAMISKVVSTAGAMARANPLKNMDDSFAISELAIEQQTDVPGSLKEVAKLEARKQILMDGIQGELSRKDPAGYANAEVLLEKYSGGIFNSKEKAAQLDEIRNTEYKDANMEYTKLQRDEKRTEKRRLETEQQLMSQYSAALNLAGNSDNKRAPIIAQIELDSLAGKISQTKKDALLGSKVFKQPGDDFYDATIMREVFKTDEYGKAVDKVYADMGSTVSRERASDIINRLKGLEERKRNDPQFQQSLRDGERLIRDMGAESLTTMMDTFSKKELLTKINIAVQDYHGAVAANPKIDPTTLSRGLIANRFGARTGFLKGKENFMSFNSVEGAEAEKQRLFKEAIELKKKKLMTPDLELKYKNNLRTIEQEKKRLMIQNPVDKSTAAPSGPSGARGK